MSTPKIDNRPRFGWTDNIDDEPQTVFEDVPDYLKRKKRTFIPVVVIPLPYSSAKVRKKIKEFVNGTLWPEKP